MRAGTLLASFAVSLVTFAILASGQGVRSARRFPFPRYLDLDAQFRVLVAVHLWDTVMQRDGDPAPS